MPRVVNVSRNPARSPTFTKSDGKLPAREQPVVTLQNLNSLLTCPLCTGYLISATSLVECGHTFCRSCLLAYSRKMFKDSKALAPLSCPICNTAQNLFLTRPQDAFKSDHLLQNLIYKLVPGLMKGEVERRRKHLETFGETDKAAKKPKAGSDSTTIHFSVECLDRSFNASTQSETPMAVNNTVLNESPHGAESAEETPNSRRTYLRCPPEMSVLQLKKFVMVRFSLNVSEEITILSSVDEQIHETLSLGDVAFLTDYDEERGPIRLFYSTTKYYNRMKRVLTKPTPPSSTRPRRRPISVVAKKVSSSDESADEENTSEVNGGDSTLDSVEEPRGQSPVVASLPTSTFQSFADPEKPKLLLRRVANAPESASTSAEPTDAANSQLPQSKGDIIKTLPSEPPEADQEEKND